jgi:hypothetical protein
MRSYIAVMVYRHTILNWTLKKYMKVKLKSREIRKRICNKNAFLEKRYRYTERI